MAGLATTGRLEIEHLVEYHKDVQELLAKWQLRNKTYDYSWNTMATIGNSTLHLEDILKDIGDLSNYKIADNS